MYVKLKCIFDENERQVIYASSVDIISSPTFVRADNCDLMSDTVKAVCILLLSA